MNIMQISRMKRDLTSEQQKAFSAELKRFYAAPPADLVVLADYVALDQSCSFTLLDVSNIERLNEINQPFAPYVEYEVIQVRPTANN
ncbi:MAG TPA: DUF3303 family protein [Syntrophales bacterium]|nr:DUF3303 family protein [Syntrophales bacterium]